MARNPKPSDFEVPVEGIGNFVFGKRDMRDAAIIEAEYARLTDGLPVDSVPPHLNKYATAMAEVAVLIVSGPETWSLDTLDPLDDSSFDQLYKVWGALRDKEESFRGAAAKSKAAGADAVP